MNQQLHSSQFWCSCNESLCDDKMKVMGKFEFCKRASLKKARSLVLFGQGVVSLYDDDV